MEKTMTTRYEDAVLLKCVDTGESEIVQLFEVTPRVQLVVDLWPATKNYRRMTLQYDAKTEDYRAEIYGRTFTSSGPKVKSASTAAVKIGPKTWRKGGR